ncbi:hypothetical protein PtB15_2B61 [Puccinia triticina]|nr:hypothetical protein PtB15_2B61 [Puccinia triticina]
MQAQSISGANHLGTKFTHAFEPTSNLADGKHDSKKLSKRFYNCFWKGQAADEVTKTRNLEAAAEKSQSSGSMATTKTTQRGFKNRLKNLNQIKNIRKKYRGSRSEQDQSSSENPDDSGNDDEFVQDVSFKFATSAKSMASGPGQTVINWSELQKLDALRDIQDSPTHYQHRGNMRFHYPPVDGGYGGNYY